MGRDFTPADNTPGAEKVALIGHGLWQRDFGGAADIVGKAIRINGKPATIVGVMPPGFSFPQNDELWIPLYSEFPVRPRNDPQANNPGVIGLLRPGVTIESASAEIDGVRQALRRGLPGHEQDVHGGPGAVAHRPVHGPAADGPDVDDAGVLRGRPADRVLQRDEHAVRAGDAPRAGTGRPVVARRHPLPADPADADREPDAGGRGRDGRRRPGVLRRGLVRAAPSGTCRTGRRRG